MADQANVSNEEIDIDETSVEDESYIRYDIASYPSDLTISVLKDMWDKENIIIPQFQRNYVWTIKQASSLVESFLLGLPVPQAFFFVDEDQNNLVIDGQQRITSLIYYLDGYFGDENFQGRRQVFRLTGLNERSPFAKKRFTELDEKDQKKLVNSVLRVVNIRQMAPRDNDTAAFHIFERLNTGGTPLRAQEIRNCVFHGAVVTSLNELNKYPSWRKIIGRENLDKHQRDVEILLRAYAMFERSTSYEKPMKEFLNISMKENIEAKSRSFKSFYRNFPAVCDKIVEAFGERPFHVRGPINLAALDSVFSESMRHPSGDFEKAQKIYAKLLNNKEYTDSIFFNTSDASAVKVRMSAVKKLF
ncbi:DUF262 domain-containing protein [Aurantimonas sp. HBX-1]|uniref:DUF262 domain-containing protein n=1 Tax=Aurantimonas sp. HBX-1 TaxID=2906072 RepID=UPI001F1FBBD0|nr:DUF262 domain-containing protein [Aurantimonas sp. HBX-1]UIJ72995.1 DUF262 domain-containing protein [Aurantimonas sp. HBX-1]